MVKTYTLPQKTIAIAGIRVQVAAPAVGPAPDTACTTVTVQATSTNTGLVYVGDALVSSTRGISLSAGQAFTFCADFSGRSGQDELLISDIWADAATSADKVNVVYQSRR